MKFTEYITVLKRRILNNDAPNRTPEGFISQASSGGGVSLGRSPSMVSSIYQTRTPPSDRLPRFASRRDYDAWNKQQLELETHLAVEIDGKEIQRPTHAHSYSSPMPIRDTNRKKTNSSRTQLLSPVDRVFQTGLRFSEDRVYERSSSVPPGSMRSSRRHQVQSPILRPRSRIESPSTLRSGTAPFGRTSPSKLNQSMSYETTEKFLDVRTPPPPSPPPLFGITEKFLDTEAPRQGYNFDRSAMVDKEVTRDFQKLEIESNHQQGEEGKDVRHLTIKCDEHHIHIHLPEHPRTPVELYDDDGTGSPSRPHRVRSQSKSPSKPRGREADSGRYVDVVRSRSLSVPRKTFLPSPAKQQHRRHKKLRHSRDQSTDDDLTPNYSYKVLEKAGGRY